MMTRADEPLKITDGVLREIAQELYRKFQVVSDNISIHVDTHGIVIYVHADKNRIILPRGPRDVRISSGHPILQPPEF